MRQSEPLQVQGRVRQLRTEFAEWDIGRQRWQSPRRRTISQFRPDGQITVMEDHYPGGSISLSEYRYDENGRLLDLAIHVDDGRYWKTIAPLQHGYSCRNATTGSIAEARRAGM